MTWCIIVISTNKSCSTFRTIMLLGVSSKFRVQMGRGWGFLVESGLVKLIQVSSNYPFGGLSISRRPLRLWVKMIGPSRHNSHVWLLLAERTDSKDTIDSDNSSPSSDISQKTIPSFNPQALSLSTPWNGISSEIFFLMSHFLRYYYSIREP